DAGLSAVRYPRDAVNDRFADDCPPFELGKARPLIAPEGDPDAAILAFGTLAIEAADAIDQLDGEYRVALYDARFAKPVDIDLVQLLIQRGVPIITIEDHGLTGGFGAAVIEACQERRLETVNI